MTSRKPVLWALVALSLVLMSTTLVEYDQVLVSDRRPLPTSTVSVVSSQTITVTPPTSMISMVSNRTITVTVSPSATNGSSVVTEAVIIQAHVYGGPCVYTTTTSTSTLYLTTSTSEGFPSSTTTETFTESTTTTPANTTQGGTSACV
jgi:hypothetical protein